MAFTNQERVRVRKYLGWPLVQIWCHELESSLDLLGADSDASTEVRASLTVLDSIETEMAGLHPIALADKVEESSLNKDRYRDLRAAGRREVQKLASMLHDAPIRKDIFATGWSGGAMGMG